MLNQDTAETIEVQCTF